MIIIYKYTFSTSNTLRKPPDIEGEGSSGKWLNDCQVVWECCL